MNLQHTIVGVLFLSLPLVASADSEDKAPKQKSYFTMVREAVEKIAEGYKEKGKDDLSYFKERGAGSLAVDLETLKILHAYGSDKKNLKDFKLDFPNVTCKPEDRETFIQGDFAQQVAENLVTKLSKGAGLIRDPQEKAAYLDRVLRIDPKDHKTLTELIFALRLAKYALTDFRSIPGAAARPGQKEEYDRLMNKIISLNQLARRSGLDPYELCPNEKVDQSIRREETPEGAVVPQGKQRKQAPATNPSVHD